MKTFQFFKGIQDVENYNKHLIHTQYAEMEKKEQKKSGNKSEGNKIVYLTNKRLRNKAGQEVKKEEESKA